MTAPHRVVALTGSAGALPVMMEVVSRAKAKDHAALFLAYHRGGAPAFPWHNYLSDGSGFRTEVASVGVPVEGNIIYHANDAESMVVTQGKLATFREAVRPRPSIDTLLTSLAGEFGDRVVAFLLSGVGKDGLAGLRAVRQARGIAIVQQPRSAPFPTLPQNAIEAGLADRVAPAPDIVALAERLVAGEHVDV